MPRRPPPRRPGRPRVSPEIKQARYDAVLDLFVRFCPRSEIVEAVGKQFELGARAIDFLIAQVRQDLGSKGFDLKAPELRIERERAFRFMQQQASDAAIKGNHAAAIRGAREICLMLGMYGAEKLEISGPNGGPLAMTVETARDRFAKKIEKLIDRT